MIILEAPTSPINLLDSAVPRNVSARERKLARSTSRWITTCTRAIPLGIPDGQPIRRECRGRAFSEEPNDRPRRIFRAFDRGRRLTRKGGSRADRMFGRQADVRGRRGFFGFGEGRSAAVGRVDNAEIRVMDRLPHPADRIDETLIRVEWPDSTGKYSARPAAHATISRRRITRKLIPCPINGPRRGADAAGNLLAASR